MHKWFVLILACTLCLGLSALAQQSLLTINSPADGTVVKPGDILSVSVSADPSLLTVAIGADGPIGYATPTSDPSVYSLTIPNDIELQTYSISGSARTSARVLIYSNQKTIDVERPDGPLELDVETDLLRYKKLGEQSQLSVHGKFKDGTRYYMTRSSRITYTSGDTNVATVDSQGMVTSVAPGKTLIVIKGVSVSGDAGQIAYSSVDVVVDHPLKMSGLVDSTVEATSAAGAPFTFSVNGIDPADTVKPATCNPASGSTFPFGPTAVACSVTDAQQDTINGTFNVTVRDTTPPVLTVPSPIVVLSATPAPVNYAASATDLVDGNVPVNCSPASGSTFPLTTTTVSCSSSDAHGNVGTGAFDVTVSSRPIDQTLAFAPIPDHYTTDPPFLLSAAASSGLPITFRVIPNSPATISGNLITLAGTTGVVAVKASQAGGGGFNPASASQQFLVVPPLQLDIFTANTGTGYQVFFTVTNVGNIKADNVTVTTAKLGNETGSPLPQSLGTIQVNSTATAIFNFSTVAVPGTNVRAIFAGSSSLGSFGRKFGPVLPNP